MITTMMYAVFNDASGTPARAHRGNRRPGTFRPGEMLAPWPSRASAARSIWARAAGPTMSSLSGRAYPWFGYPSRQHDSPVTLGSARGHSVLWAAVGAVGSIAAAAAAAWAAHQSNASAGKANEAAGALLAIERDRRHEELTPQFEITRTIKAIASDSADLWVELIGGPVERHAAVSVTIQDEVGQDHWGRGLPGGVAAEGAEAFVSGPWEFNTGAGEQVVSNRQSRERPFDQVSGKNWELLSLTRMRPGRWMTGTSQDQWRKQWRDKPVRLLLTCRCEGYDPWFI
jgi:hypothetical protein